MGTENGIKETNGILSSELVALLRQRPAAQEPELLEGTTEAVEAPFSGRMIFTMR